MLEAIRNLGILKMIQEFPDDFNHEALESVKKFLEQRGKAIQRGIYGMLQFEPIGEEEIGVFSISGDEISFKKSSKTDDTSKYIFRKTPGSQAAYISPTWKAAKSNKKLESTVECFREFVNNKNTPKKDKEIFLRLLKVFNADDIMVEEDGAKLISNFEMVGEKILLSNEEYRIIKKDASIQELYYGITKTITSYSFLTPWLALNEKNYEKYQKYGTWAKKKELLEKILVGNIISMSKSLGYTVPEPIKANIGNLKEVKTSLKGTPMLGFRGTFSVNFEIPDYWGIGKSVSRGFGTIKRVKELRKQGN